MALLDLLCPTRCEGCGAHGASCCPGCRAALSAPAYPHRPSPCPPGLPSLWVVAPYAGGIRGLLLGFKERGAVGLAGPLAEALASAVQSARADHRGQLLLVPVPSSRAAVRDRGDDVVELLALRAARRLRATRVDVRAARVLVQRRRVADSAGLSAARRAVNLQGALGVRAGRTRGLAGAAVVIVDDLVTTGATLTEAARSLRLAGAEVIGAAAIAATQRRQSAAATGGV